MTRNFETKYLGYHVPDALNPRIAEFKQMIALLANEVIVLPEAVTAFVLGLLVSKLVANNQIAINQQFQRIVDRGPGNCPFLPLQAQKKLIRIEMICRVVNGFENG